MMPETVSSTDFDKTASVPERPHAVLEHITPSLKTAYRPDIDGLRGVAVLAVVTFHAAPGRLAAGFIGVDVFFVISGFLISSILFKDLKDGDFSFARFYARRIRRIFPALALVLMACLVAGWFVLVADEYGLLGKHVAAGAAFSSNFLLWSEVGYFENQAEFKILLHLWSLGIEEQFYILWPLLLWAGWKYRRSLPAAICAVALASFVLSLYLSSKHPAAAFYLPLSRAWELLAGSLLAYAGLNRGNSAEGSFSDRAMSNASSVGGALLLLSALALIDRNRVFPGWWAMLPVLASVMMIAAGPRAWLNRVVLSNRLLVWVGLISYPLYLWHWPILSFLRTLEGEEVAQTTRFFAVAASFILAWGTYQLIEKPVRRRATKMVGATFLMVLMAVTASLGIYTYLSNGFQTRTSTLPKIINEGEIGPYYYFDYVARHYFPCTPLDIQKEAGDWNGYVRCSQSKDSVIKDFAIIGDSHAEHLFAGLAEKLPTRNVVFYGKGGLPLKRNEEYHRIFEYVLNDNNIRVVLISAAWKVKLQTYSQRQFKTELRETIDVLTAAGKRVYITDGGPVFSFNPGRCKYANRLWLENKCSEVDTPPPFDYKSTMLSVASDNNASSVISTYNQFCQNGVCYMARNGVLDFRDTNHLNVLSSKTLAEKIVEQMDK